MGNIGLILLVITAMIGGASVYMFFSNNSVKIIDLCQDPYVGLFSRNNSINGVYYPGDWIHVNVNSLNYTRALEVCKHEVGHEIFAEVCENNFDKCLEMLK